MDIVFLARIHACMHARCVTLRLCSLTRGRCWPLWSARVSQEERKRVERRWRTHASYVSTRTANVHAFSSQIEYVPVSGVGVNDKFVCRNDTRVCRHLRYKCSDSFDRLLRGKISERTNERETTLFVSCIIIWTIIFRLHRRHRQFVNLTFLYDLWTCVVKSDLNSKVLCWTWFLTWSVVTRDVRSDISRKWESRKRTYIIQYRKEPNSEGEDQSLE